jgi:hypothetical protein
MKGIKMKNIKLYDMGITIVLGMAIVGYVIIHLCGK